MTYYFSQGSTVKLADNADVVVTDNLPVGNYVVKFNEQTGTFYLEQAEEFSIPSKLYGGVEKRADRIISTFRDRTQNTGVLLTGEKGSGKTMLARLISFNLAEHGIPTIIVSSEYYGETFNQFISQIDQECVIVFDEFEKLYDRESQTQVLTLLDGLFSKKKMFIITVNNIHSVDEHLINRPGRIYYYYDYAGLEREFVSEYCELNLVDKSQTADVLRVCSVFGAFNFDMLAGMVQEMNRYGETARDVLKHLNIRPGQAGTWCNYNITITVPGVEAPVADYRENINLYTMGPVIDRYINVDAENTGLKLDDGGEYYFCVTFQDIVKLSETEIIIRDKNGVTARLTKSASNRPDIFDVF